MLSVNQMNAQIKLTEAWKITNIPNYPTKWDLKTKNVDERLTRAAVADIVPETARTTLAQNTFNNDAKKLWNKAPCEIKKAKTLTSAKKLSKSLLQLCQYSQFIIQCAVKAQLDIETAITCI